MADQPLSRRAGALVIAGVFVIAAFFIGSALSGWSFFGAFSGEPYEEIGPTVVESVRQIAELATVEMVEYTTIEKGNDYGWLNWARGDRIFMFAVARIGAGVDLAKMSPGSFEVDTDTGVVRVTLPEPEVLFVEVDNESTQVYDRDTGVFTKGDPQLESDARAAAQELLVQAAMDHGILGRAEDNARTVLRQLLLGLGYEEVFFVREVSP